MSRGAIGVTPFQDAGQQEELRCGARKRTRTSTAFRPPDPKSGASANSAIRACGFRTRASECTRESGGVAARHQIVTGLCLRRLIAQTSLSWVYANVVATSNGRPAAWVAMRFGTVSAALNRRATHARDFQLREPHIWHLVLTLPAECVGNVS